MSNPILIPLKVFSSHIEPIRIEPIHIGSIEPIISFCVRKLQEQIENEEDKTKPYKGKVLFTFRSSRDSREE